MSEKDIQRTKQRYDIIGNSEALNRAIEIALKIAPVDLTVLVTGENGAGKEVFPRIIHDHSLRKTKKYFAVNCGAIPEGTIDSELFGHEKGAFTGAVEKRDGYFTVANGGTLFLDEVGELPLPTQARLLRVLETGEYIPVGSSTVRKTDVRIVCATNMDMEQAVADHKFREDLYYRLNTVSISVPPLRERGEDAVLLFRKFAFEMSEKYRMPALRLDEEAASIIASYPWPGNVRQLKNVAENMSVTAEERLVTAPMLRQYLPEVRRGGQLTVVGSGNKGEHSFESEREILYRILFDLRRDVTELKDTMRKMATLSPTSDVAAHPIVSTPDTSGYTELPYAEAEEVEGADEARDKEKPAGIDLHIDRHERELIREALRQTGGHRHEAALLLGISDRTLYRKIKEYGLED